MTSYRRLEALKGRPNRAAVVVAWLGVTVSKAAVQSPAEIVMGVLFCREISDTMTFGRAVRMGDL